MEQQGKTFQVTREACRDTGQMAQCNDLKQLRPKRTVSGAAVRCFDLKTKPAVEIVDIPIAASVTPQKTQKDHTGQHF
ncbi:MAG: hypothetical protein WBN02_01815 [Sedimenticolaceae bacterium]